MGDNIINAVSKLTKSIGKTSGTLLKSTKLTLSLANEEERLNNIYMEIGKKVHEIYAYGGNLGSFFDSEYEAIIEQEKKISDLREELDALKGTKTCPKCNNTISKKSVFCPKCGAKLDEQAVEPKLEIENKSDEIVIPSEDFVEVAKAEVPPLESDLIVCKACGVSNSSKDKFCVSCGRAL